jgi:hypothetical protein
MFWIFIHSIFLRNVKNKISYMFSSMLDLKFNTNEPTKELVFDFQMIP